MTWMDVLKFCILALWVSICISMMIGTWGDKRFGSGHRSANGCTRACSEGHTYDKRCGLR